MSDRDFESAENELPAIAGQAFAAARKEALDAGFTLVEAKDGFVYEISPDGTRKVIKQINPPTHIDPTKVYTIR